MPTQQEKINITEWVMKWRDILYLERHSISLVFADEPDSENPEKMAEILQNDPYLDVEIVIFPGLFNREVDEQERIVCHELCHLITFPMAQLLFKILSEEQFVSRSSAIAAMEHCTDMITSVLCRIVPLTPPPPTPKKKAKKKNDSGKSRGSNRQAGIGT